MLGKTQSQQRTAVVAVEESAAGAARSVLPSVEVPAAVVEPLVGAHWPIGMKQSLQNLKGVGF